MASELGPLYTHDCERCTFLGRSDPIAWHGPPTVYDLYHCTQGGLGDTVIARYGNDGPEYTSGLGPWIKHPALIESAKRAKERGLLPVSGKPGHYDGYSYSKAKAEYEEWLQGQRAAIDRKN